MGDEDARLLVREGAAVLDQAGQLLPIVYLRDGLDAVHVSVLVVIVVAAAKVEGDRQREEDHEERPPARPVRAAAGHAH